MKLSAMDKENSNIIVEEVLKWMRLIHQRGKSKLKYIPNMQSSIRKDRNKREIICHHFFLYAFSDISLFASMFYFSYTALSPFHVSCDYFLDFICLYLFGYTSYFWHIYLILLLVEVVFLPLMKSIEILWLQHEQKNVINIFFLPKFLLTFIRNRLYW